MSHDYLTGYLPDSDSRLRHERKKALRNVLIIAVVIAAFFYVLTKAVRIIVKDNRIVHYPISVNSDVNSDKVSLDEIIYYEKNSADQAKVSVDTSDVDKELARTNQEIEKLTEQVVANEKISHQPVSSQQPLAQENNTQKTVKQEASPVLEYSIEKSTTSVESAKPIEKRIDSKDSSDTDEANSQQPIDLKDLEAIYNKQLSIILDDN